MDYLFAPMEGITGYVFRNAHHRHFHGIKEYYTPFISPNQTRKLTPRELNDVIPEHNEGIPLIPQILTNKADDFLWAAKRLKELGYMEVTLNLGCPSGTVVAKKRGSGFLEYPMELDEFLYQVSEGICGLGMDLSVKTRIGKTDPQEFEELLSIYNRYPLKNLIVHPRVQTDYYKNHPNLDAFRIGLEKSTCPVCYNGDIRTVEDLEHLHQQFPQLEHVMIGRGLLTDPALAEKLETANAEGNISSKRFREFHDELYSEYQSAFSGEKPVLFKMKELWVYWGEQFPGEEKALKQIRKAQRLADYESAARYLLY